MPPVPLVEVVRSGVLESVHLGSVAVADASGRLVASAGEPEVVAFARSAMKPLQAAVSLAVAGRSDDVPDEEVAVAAGSHNGEDVHLSTVRSLLERAGATEADLRCPPSLPLDPDAALAVSVRRPILHNCSGKHAAMLLACARAGHDVRTYVAADHPLQRRVLEVVRLAAGAPESVGVDGCGVPVHALTLAEMATLYARLARPERIPETAATVERVTAAMRRAPYLVEGRGRTATAIMQAGPALIAKGGAEGLACAASLEAGLGVAVKVADGSARAATPALVRALRLLDLLDEAGEASIEEVGRPPVLGGGRRVGELLSVFSLAST